MMKTGLDGVSFEILKEFLVSRNHSGLSEFRGLLENPIMSAFRSCIRGTGANHHRY